MLSLMCTHLLVQPLLACQQRLIHPHALRLYLLFCFGVLVRRSSFRSSSPGRILWERLHTHPLPIFFLVFCVP
jgi:hypothetical protein